MGNRGTTLDTLRLRGLRPWESDCTACGWAGDCLRPIADGRGLTGLATALLLALSSPNSHRLVVAASSLLGHSGLYQDRLAKHSRFSADSTVSVRFVLAGGSDVRIRMTLQFAQFGETCAVSPVLMTDAFFASGFSPQMSLLGQLVLFGPDVVPTSRVLSQNAALKHGCSTRSRRCPSLSEGKAGRQSAGDGRTMYYDLSFSLTSTISPARRHSPIVHPEQAVFLLVCANHVDASSLNLWEQTRRLVRRSQTKQPSG